MPSYYNPYNFYPATYANQMGYSGMPMQQVSQMPQQSYAAPVSQGPKMMEWVEGEVGAKAFQMPNGWPANSPIPLWDSTDTVIYLKSWGPMGIPNPMQKLRYEMPESQNQAMLMSGDNGNSGNGQNNRPDMSQYVTKQDLESIKKDMLNAINSMNTSGMNGGGSNSGNTQNGSNSGQNGNRGGNRNG